MPWYLQVAIEHALSILNWYENLPKDEVPPEHLWEDPEGLELWWKDVEAQRQDDAPTRRGRGDRTDSDDDGDADRGPEMVENDYARYLKQ